MASRKTWAHLGKLAICGLALVMGRQYHEYFIAPLRQREAEVLREVEDFGKRLAEARKTIVGIRVQENDEERVRSELQRRHDELPAGVELPALATEHFARFEMAVPSVRLDPTLDEPELPGYARGHWSVTLPINETGRNIPRTLLAISDLEQENSYVRVLSFHIRPDYDNPGRRVGALNLSALIRK